MHFILMSLGFTKSKEDSNLYFKVEGGKPMVLLLYVDDLFLIGEDELIVDTKRRLVAKFGMKDLGMMPLFLRSRGVVEIRWDIPWSKKVYNRDFEEIRNDGLQGH